MILGQLFLLEETIWNQPYISYIDLYFTAQWLYYTKVQLLCLGPFLSNCKARLMILGPYLPLHKTIWNQPPTIDSDLYFMIQWLDYT